MVEITQLLDLPEGFFGMAFTAILAEFIVMNIFMATCAILKGDTGKFLHFDPITERSFMTFQAIDSSMFPPQIEPGLLMFKF